MYNFADRLKFLRKTKKINQEVLAEILNISRKQISQYENGKDMPSVSSIMKLANYFKVSIEYILGITSDNDVEKIWLQQYRNKRLELFQNPEGKFEYYFFENGEKKKSIFKYVFGIFPLPNIDFQPIFFYLEEEEGCFLELMTEFPKIKQQLKCYDEDYFDLRSGIITMNNLPFLAFSNFLNQKFQLGYRLDMESNHLQRVNLIVKVQQEFNPIPIYCEIKSGTGMPVKTSEIFDGFAYFLHNFYLIKTKKEKIDFLRDYQEKAFEW